MQHILDKLLVILLYNIVFHPLIILGLVHSLGRDTYGRLGLGADCGDQSVPTVIPTLQSEKCTEISCGNCVSFAVTKEGI